MDNMENEGIEKEIPESVENSTPETTADIELKEEIKPSIGAPIAQKGFIDPTKMDLVEKPSFEFEKISSEERKIKKFVIHIDAENIEYFEGLHPEDRNKLINEYLEAKISSISKERKKKFVAQFLRHLLIVILTIVIGFPIVFYIVNKSITSTIKSYQYMQVNFGKLYQEKAMKKSL